MHSQSVVVVAVEQMVEMVAVEVNFARLQVTQSLLEM
jgi:hypothetical protein